MDRQWFMDDEFETPLPEAVSKACARVYGTGDLGIDFAQGLAAFLAIEYARQSLVESLCE